MTISRFLCTYAETKRKQPQQHKREDGRRKTINIKGDKVPRGRSGTRRRMRFLCFDPFSVSHLYVRACACMYMYGGKRTDGERKEWRSKTNCVVEEDDDGDEKRKGDSCEWAKGSN